MADDPWYSEVKQAPPASQQPKATPPAGKKDDPWYSEVGHPVTTPAAQPAPVTPTPSPDGHGDLYSAAKRVLDFKPSPETGNAILDAINAVGDAPTNMLQGVAKGALSTASGLGSIYNKLTGSKQPFNQENLSGLTDSNGVAQGIGKTAEQVGEYFLGLGEAKGATGLLGAAAKSGLVSGIQSGGDPVAAGIGAATPVVAPFLTKAAGSLLSKGLGITTGAGEKAIQRAFANP